MTDPPPADHSPDDPSQQAIAQKTGDFRELSRKITSRTTDLLAVSILLVGGLVLASHVARWWNTDPAELASSMPPPPLNPWDDPSGVVLEFTGAPWSLRRQLVPGTESQATARLQEHCRTLVNAPISDEMLPPVDESEQNLLDRLAEWTPIEESPDGARLYAIGGPLPWIVGTRQRQHDSLTPANRAGEPSTGARPDERVICWGIALPQPAGTWMLYVLDRRVESDDSAAYSASEFPLPEGVTKSMTIRSDQGGTLVCLSGNGTVSAAMREFDETLTRSHWRKVRDWNGDGHAHVASFVTTSENAHLSVDLTLAPSGDRGWTGVGDCRWAPVTDGE